MEYDGIRWNTTGKVITVLLNRQYRIRVDGSGRIVLTNRLFLRKCKFKTAPKLIPTPAAITPTINTPLLNPDPPTSFSNDTHIFTHPRSSKIPRALSRLIPHNRPGLKERHSPLTIRPARGGGWRWRSYYPNAQGKIITTHLPAQQPS